MKVTWLIEDLTDDNSLTCNSISILEGQNNWFIEDFHPQNILESENLCYREICFTIEQAVFEESGIQNLTERVEVLEENNDGLVDSVDLCTYYLLARDN